MKDKVLLWLKRFTMALLIVLTLFLLTVRQTYAYIDPGTGGMIIQGLIGLLVGALATVGILWKRITASAKNMFRRSSKAENQAGEEDIPAT